MSEKITLKNVYQLVYASKAAEGFSEKDLVDILRIARKTNKELLITGALVYNKGFFLQLLEGEREAVETLFKDIENDTRHKKVNCFNRNEVPNRIFPDWYMGFFQHDLDESFALTGIVNIYESEHPASQFFIQKLLEVQTNLHIHQSTTESDDISDINWIIEEICSPSMHLMFDMMNDSKFAKHVLKLKLGLDSLSVGVILCDMQRDIAYVNKSAVQILNDADIKNYIRIALPDFSVEQLIGKNIDSFHINPAHQINILEKLTHTVEYIINLGGHLLSVKTTAIKDETDQRIGYMAEIDDITIKEKNKADLLEEVAKNKKLNHQVLHMQKLESINRLTSGIAHDFNNLLMAIAGYNECNKFSAEDVLLESISREQVSTEFLENSKQIQIATDKAVRLIEKMLLYCRRDGGGEIHHPVLNLNEVLEENLKMLRSTIPTSINFERILVDQNLNLLNIDETYLSQIIVNLFVNAQDAINGNKKGTITLKTNVVEYAQLVCSCCQCNVDGRFVEITVADNGSGIDPAIAKRIFEPFFTTKQVGDGTGLGLSVIVGMVHNAGGHVLLESEVGVGSTFRLLFPIS
jgi:signal transduction histidine kinase